MINLFMVKIVCRASMALCNRIEEKNDLKAPHCHTTPFLKKERWIILRHEISDGVVLSLLLGVYKCITTKVLA